MRKYRVTIPIVGSVTVDVEVPDNTNNDSIYAAATMAYNDNPTAHDLEWSFYQKITSGNVLHVDINEWYKERLKEPK